VGVAEVGDLVDAEERRVPERPVGSDADEDEQDADDRGRLAS
jgi:hypothetical protein